MNSPMIEITNLSKEFHPSADFLLSLPGKRKILALDRVNLRVEKGELFSLIGPNGAGKTTLIKILAGSILPTRGKVLIGGYDAAREEMKVKTLIGIVAGEERSFYWRLSGRQNLEFFAALYGLKKEEADSRIVYLMRMLNISDAGMRFQEYPSGLKQKFFIARSLLHEPEVVIMDEPTRNLDPLAAEDLRIFIKEELVGKKGKTVIFCTHNLAESSFFGGRVAVMNKGRIVSCGPLGELAAGAGLPAGASPEEVFKHYVNA